MTDRERAARWLDKYVKPSGGKVGGFDALAAEFAAANAERDKRIATLEAALREWTVNKFGVGNVECRVCWGIWREGAPESHKADCLNNPAALSGAGEDIVERVRAECEQTALAMRDDSAPAWGGLRVADLRPSDRENWYLCCAACAAAIRERGKR